MSAEKWLIVWAVVENIGTMHLLKDLQKLQNKVDARVCGYKDIFEAKQAISNYI